MRLERLTNSLTLVTLKAKVRVGRRYAEAFTVAIASDAVLKSHQVAMVAPANEAEQRVTFQKKSSPARQVGVIAVRKTLGNFFTGQHLEPLTCL